MIQNLKDMSPLVDVVSKWRLYIGIPKSEDLGAELALVTEFIYSNYGFLTLSEIELAYNLSITRKLDDVEFYGSFSPLYVGKVLQSYLYYRKITMADAIRKKEKFDQQELEKKNKPTPEEEAKLTKEIVADFYKKSRETGEVDDPFNICYNLFRKAKFLKVSQDDIDEATLYGEKKYQENRKSPNLFAKFQDNKELEVKRHARNYLVLKYFDTISIDILLLKIRPELFINE